MEDIVLLGIGGHAKSIVDSVECAGEFHIIGFLDYPDKNDFTYRGYGVIGEDPDLEALYESGVKYAFPTVGFMGKSTVRSKLYDKLCSIGFCIPNIVDTTAIIAKDAKLIENSGIFVGKGTIINSNASIHEMSIINSGSVIEHDCEVGAFSHIAVGAVVCGGAKIGIHTMVGANATILQERIIGNKVIIGAGCTVTTDIADDETLYSSIYHEHIYIIAEAGVNHGGDIALAKKMIEAAASAGADAVKFQTFQTEKMVTINATKAVYQKNTTDCQESQYQMLKKLELTKEEYLELAECCRRQNIDFLTSPFDLESVDFLSKIPMKYWKIPSGEITNYPYLIKVANQKKEIILSTGMSTTQEIKDALKVLKEHGADKIVLLHCNTEYPTPMQDVNLNAMHSLRRQFGLNVGYSDHTLGIEIPIAASAMGAVIIEKHFTLDKMVEGPDHKASLDPTELKNMVKAIRDIEKAMGNGVKVPSESETPNIMIARKSIVASKKIVKGEMFTEENITAKRPGTGISPMKWEYVLGKAAPKDFQEDEQISFSE